MTEEAESRVAAANARLLPFAELMGVRYVEAERDRFVAEMVVREDLCTFPATLHGGAIMALADTVAATATFASLPEGAGGTTTIESKTNFLAGAPVGAAVRAVATPLHRGRRTQVWQTRVESAEGRLLAIVTQTQMVL
jgi:uncharacterized protein (TIGR00369 family)